MSKQNPEHYRQGDIEPWDFIVSQKLGFLEGNIIKYITRAGKKDSESRFDDLLKAQAYIHKLVLTEVDASAIPPRPNATSDRIQGRNESDSRELFAEWHEDPNEFNL
jgi:hypothetical protein